MKRAFTLIELLVVIAIIAILAAILFPVFAQAKEAAKKTQTLSNTKQTSTSVILYTTDSDDYFPLSNSVDDGGACGYGAKNAGQLLTQSWAATTPAGADDPSCEKIDMVAWNNSTQPYRKSYDLMTQAGAQQFDLYVASYMATFVKAPALGSISMNGLLSEYSATAVALPSKNPLIWPGSYKYNFRGGTSIPANPSLYCGAQGSGGGACKFSAGSSPSSKGWSTGRGDQYWSFVNLSNTLWMYGRGFTYAATDSSAHFVNQGRGASYNGPMLSLDANGAPAATLRCTTTGVAGGVGLYNSWFRPDSQYNYPLSATGLACGW